MLQVKTLHKDTLALFKVLSVRKNLDAFVLAGGTALALQLGIESPLTSISERS